MFDWFYRHFSKEHREYVTCEVNLLKRCVFEWKTQPGLRQYYARLVYSTLDIIREVDPHVAKQIEERNAELLKKIREDCPAWYFQNRSTEPK